jgi:NTP pyrophosphatase (non-canonical NTP hydrolase)
MISTVEEYLKARLEARSSVSKMILSEKNNEGKLLATEAADIALQGIVRVGSKIHAAYSSTILSQMGLSEDIQEKCDEVAFITPAALPLDDAALAIWHWQQQLDDRATVNGVLNHLKEEVQELTEAATAYSENDTIKTRMDVGNELADIFVLAFHLSALLNLDPAQCLAEKLRLLHERDYSAQPDEDGKIKHEEA